MTTKYKTASHKSPEAPSPTPFEPQSSDRLGTRLAHALAGRYRMAPVLASIVLIWGFFQSQNQSFLTPRNMTNLSVQIVVTALLALGLVLILIIKEIDLSVAALSAVCAGTMAHLMVERGIDSWVAIPAAIIAGMLVGLVQGAIVTRFRAASFIVTLGTSLALQGVLLVLLPQSGSLPLSGTSVQWIANSFIQRGVGYVVVVVAAAIVAFLLFQSLRHKRRQGLNTNMLTSVVLPVTAILVAGLIVVFVLNQDRGVPTPVAILLLLLAVMAYVTTQTRVGTYLYAIGGNAEASKRAAISVARVKMTTFVLAGAFAAVAGIIAASQTLGVSAQSGSGTLLLEAVAAAVIGGASLFGGRGSVWAALIGALLMGSITNGLALMSASTETKYVVQGIVLVLAVTVDSLLSKETKRT
ncbi:sugar ABC transporter permease [Paenarthrobacter sp. NPDC092416]|uniref:sugar ABC transporter permease n=1 Tax=Paenarthrobacter sp. NPDC092416 TaxID=3364386 RepID=UPI0037F93C0A